MVKKKIDIRKLRERARASSPITDDDREFMRKIEDRIPYISPQHSSDISANDGDVRLDEWYLRKFRKITQV